MILDKIENSFHYDPLGGEFKKVFETIKSTDFTKLEPGKYEIDGDNLYYIVQFYDTKPLDESRFEAHQKYIDVQFMASGNEMIGYTPLEDDLKSCGEYSEDSDVELFEQPREFTLTKFGPGMFAIFYPEDAHMPCIRLDETENVCKVVFKVIVNG